MVKPLLLALNSEYFKIDGSMLEDIRGTAPGCSIEVANQWEAASEKIAEAEIIFGLPNYGQLGMAKKLKWLHIMSAGAEKHNDRSRYANKDTVLTNSSGVYGQPISEHILTLIFTHNRNMELFYRWKNEHKWDKGYKMKDFFDSTVGIIGLGDIGTEVARKSKALGARVLAVKRRVTEKPDFVDELYGEDGIDKLLEQSDYVVLALPTTGKTSGIIAEERINRMKKDAFLVNVGRGALIDQEALIRALREERIGGAGLDVTFPEPLPPESPLWSLPNVIITPHASGSSPSNTKRRFGIFLENLKRHVEGRPLANVVDFDTGY